jgi:general L-amino acid transport system ATP-binding protein
MAIMEQDRVTDKVAAAKADKSGPMIEISGLNKWYVDFHVLKDINLNVGRGERIVICGPSGSGKSTLIRCINRLESHQEGSIIVDGIELNEDVKNIEEIRREVSQRAVRDLCAFTIPVGMTSGTRTLTCAWIP